VLFGCFTYSVIATPPVILRTPDQEIRSAEITYLPNTGGGDAGGSAGARGREGEGLSASGPKRKGITFKGPQYIRSDYPDPDNNLQTILQPALSKAPRLNFPLQVPNIIRVARPKPQDVTPPKLKVKVSVKDIPLPTPTTKPVLKAEAELIATPLHNEKVPLLALPEMQAITKNAEPEKLVVTLEEKVQPPPVMTADAAIADQSLAVLNAMHITTPTLVIPPGEKRASFEVSPAGTASTHGADSRAGIPGGPSSAGSGTGVGNARAGAGEGGSGIGSGHAGNGGGRNGSGSGAGNAGKGRGNGASGSGSGVSGSGGNGTGHGPGSGNGSGSGSGSGAGSGPGDGPFPGIQVIGGAGSGIEGNSGGGGHARSANPRSYDFTIIASGGSGGGLKDFGVFHNQAVYTVYIDVSDIAPTSQAWVLQYADTGSGPRTAEINLGATGNIEAPAAMLEPPYAMEKQLPEKLSSAPTSAMTVITGIISRDGKLENAKVLQAPTEEVGKQWAEAVAKWSFRPASKNGTPVPVRVLVGIPAF
jgi:hypothetical protein